MQGILETFSLSLICSIEVCAKYILIHCLISFYQLHNIKQLQSEHSCRVGATPTANCCKALHVPCGCGRTFVMDVKWQAMPGLDAEQWMA